MKKNILVFPCGSEIGLNIYHLVRFSTHFHLIGGSSVPDHGRFVYDDYEGNIPYIDSEDFLDYMKKLIEKRNIAAIYPTMDSVISILKNHEEDLGCKVIGPHPKITDICLSKELTYKKLNGIIKLPIVYDKHNVTHFPVFIKPKIGYGSRGAKIVHSLDELNKESALQEKLILEYLPGDEYTVDCFSNKEHALIYCSARKRNRIRMGISVNCSFEKDQNEFYSIASKINNCMRFRGAWFFQVKRDKSGELTLLEVASRFGGSSLLSAAIGVNFPLMTLFDAFGYNVTIQKNSYDVELDRAFSYKYKTNLQYSTVYVDFDDCLFLNKTSINVELISFLYTCLNKGIKIVLLTKHDGNLRATLQQLRISSLFDEVIHIRKDDEKYRYIDKTDSIFIDDSFLEREKISRNCNIPVFSPEMIDVLK